jgi:hypothetical protein
MYFPFFTYKIKYKIRDLIIADKQNTHNITMAVRNIIEFFKLVNREDEFYQIILIFFILYNASIVRIYGHYALIKNRTAKFYRYSIKEFAFTSEEGKEK